MLQRPATGGRGRVERAGQQLVPANNFFLPWLAPLAYFLACGSGKWACIGPLSQVVVHVEEIRSSLVESLQPLRASSNCSLAVCNIWCRYSCS